MELSVIRNIFWDAEGALLDTYPAITYALCKSLNEVGVAVALNEIDRLVRRSFLYCLATLCERFSLDHNLLLLRFSETYQSVPIERHCLYPWVTEVCALIQSRGLNIAMTRQTQDAFERFLTSHRLAPYFAGIISPEQTGACKSKPVRIRAALEKYNLQPDETLVVSRHEIAIQAGRELSLRTCFLGQEAVLAKPVDLQVTDHSQLLKWLTSQAASGAARIQKEAKT